MASRKSRRASRTAAPSSTTYAAPAKTCVKVASTKHYFLHFNKKNGKFFYKGESFVAADLMTRFEGRDDNHAILFSAIAAQYLDWAGSADGVCVVTGADAVTEAAPDGVVLIKAAASLICVA